MSELLTPMNAVIVEVPTRRVGRGPDGGNEGTLLEVIWDHFSSEKWALVLRVTAPDGTTFRHAGRYKIANRLGGLSRINTMWRPLPGLAVPVLVSPDRRTVDIDWQEFVARSGIEQAAELTGERRSQQGTAQLGAMLRKNPKMAAKQREFVLAHGSDQAVEVTTGVRPAAEFSRAISGWVQGGALSTEEGNELLRQAGLL